jgi:hypothetical protein
MQLKLFSEREARQFHEVDDASVEVFHDFVHDRHGFEFVVYDGVFVFWA